MKATHELSVVVPICNEELVLWDTAQALAAHLDRLVGPGRWQYILVDNGSRDATPAVVRKIVAAWPQSSAIELLTPNYGAALRAGLAAASAEWAHIINVDFWDFPFLAWAWQHRHDYDLMLGSKRAEPTLDGRTRYRRLLSWGLNSVLALLCDFVGSDTHGPKFLRMGTMRSVLEQCVLEQSQFDTEFTLRAMRKGLRLAEVPVPCVEKRKQRGWMIPRIAWTMKDLFRLRKEIRAVPWQGPLRYQRWSRADVERVAQAVNARDASGATATNKSLP